MTTLVTLEVQSPGDNDSVSLVPVRIRLSLKHACALIVGTGDTSLIVYNLDTFDKLYCASYFMIIYCFTVYNPDMSGKFYCTVDFSPFYGSGTKNLKYLVETGENGFTVYNPDTSGNFYCTAYYSLFYASGKKT